MLKQKVYLLLESLVQSNDLDLDFYKYLFQLITLLKPDFNCCNNFALSCVDKVTTGTYNSASVIANVAF